MSLLKDLHYNENVYLELRVEAFNALNHPNFGNPNTNIDNTSSTGAGTINSASNPRVLQGGVKIYF